MNKETEVWIPIPNYEGLYEASNLGKIRSVDRVNNRGAFIHGRVLKGTSNGRGYLSLWLSKDGEKKRWLIHRLIAITFIDKTDEQADAIRADSRTCKEIAKEYGVCTMTVSNIKRGKFYQARVV